MTSKNLLINTLFAFSLVIILLISINYDQYLQFLFFIFLPLVLGFIFIKLNRSKMLYFSVSIILILLGTVAQGLNIILPATGGLLVTLMFIRTWEMRLLLNKAGTLIKKHKTEEALPYLDKILELNPQSFFALYNKSAALSYNGKYEESLVLVDKILKNKPKNMLALIMKASLLLNLERYDESLEIVDNVLKKDSKNELALSSKALVLSRQWKYEESLEYFEKAVKTLSNKTKLGFVRMPVRIIISPKKVAEVWFEKGKVHQRLGQYKEALECFDKADDLYPNSEQILKYKEILNLMEN